MWVAIQDALLALQVPQEIVTEKKHNMAPLGEREEKRRRPHR
jgi:hypothetical protein